MIQWMSQLSKSWVATFLMGGLAISFVVWGIADVFTGVSSSAVATVGGVDITPEYYNRAYRGALRQEGEDLHTAVTPDMAQRMGMPLVVLQQLITRAVEANIASRLGLTTADSEVAGYVRQQPGFRGITGFDHNQFLRLIQGAGYTEDDYLADVRADLTRQQLATATESDFAAPDGLVSALYSFLNERRAVQYVIVAPTAVGPVAPPSDAVLAAYVKANAGRYSTPEYRDVTFAQIGPEDLMSKVTVAEADIQKYYNLHLATYVVPEKRDLEQIEFKTEADAKAAKARLDGGLSFEALAAQMKLKPADITLGTLAKTDLPDPDRANAAFALGENQVSAPVKGAFGWVLIKAGKVTPGTSRSPAQAHDEIKQALAAELAGAKMVDIVNSFQEARGSGTDIQTAAKNAGMKADHVTIDSNGLSPAGDNAGPADAEFRAQVFAAQVGEEGDPFATKTNHYYAIKVNGVTPPKLKSLDQVRTAAIADWSNDQRARMVIDKARELTAAAQKDGNLNGIAKTLKVGLQSSPGLTRGTNDTTFSQDMVTRLFAMAPNAIAGGPQGRSGNFIIAQITGIAYSAPSGLEYQSTLSQLSQSIAGDLTVSMANAARADQKVRVNQKLLDSTVGQGS